MRVNDFAKEIAAKLFSALRLDDICSSNLGGGKSVSMQKQADKWKIFLYTFFLLASRCPSARLIEVLSKRGKGDE